MICRECETVAHCTSHGCIPKTTKKGEAMKLALEALTNNAPGFRPDIDTAITALREALAEQPARCAPAADGVCESLDCPNHKPAQQEPTCKPYLHVWVQRTGQFSWEPQDERFWTRLTSPQPQRTWVGLTDEEQSLLWEISRAALPRYATFYRLTEAKLKEKNT